MDIPDAIKNLTLDKHDFMVALVTPEKKGELISLAALAEENVEEYLCRYYAKPEHACELGQAISDNLSFYTKIEMMGKILKDDASGADHVRFLHALRRLRNAAAHGYGITGSDADKLYADTTMRELLGEFPKRLWARVTALRDYLQNT